ncbi:hypothetical protein QCA50_009529 [Cerrena zonata]|uniref:Uncharacterized protein n=1 Tax=Cerrena zonata TaxID=2478898 RepID=A0AAW0G5S1_9APHY
MIILDNETEQHPKLAQPIPAYTIPVNRCSTSSSSLPDYDASEALHQKPLKPPRRRISRLWKIIICVVFVYCFLTLAVGVPLLVVKLKEHYPKSASAPAGWSPQQANVVVIPGMELANNPPAFEDEDDCDAWTKVDRTEEHMKLAHLNYTIPFSGNIFIGSNGSYMTDGPDKSISGTIFVDINDDSSVQDMDFQLSMAYNHSHTMNRTHVCRTNKMDNTGVYIYIPNDLDSDDILTFNITLLLPQPGPAINYSSFATMLPLFHQHYGYLSPTIKFRQVFLGGPKSTVLADSFAADSLAIMSSPGNITGSFQAGYQLVLETMSAPISANISMHTSGDWAQSIVRLNTGNDPLSAEISLVPTKGKKSQKYPAFYIDVNTFSAPLYLSISQKPEDEDDLTPVFLHASNNLGAVRVEMDSHYEGTFTAQTEYARTVVLDTPTGGITADDTDNLASNATFVKTTPDSAQDPFGRTLYYDSVSATSVHGWVGRGKRPSMMSTSGAPGCIEIMSVLSPVTLELGQP